MANPLDAAIFNFQNSYSNTIDNNNNYGGLSQSKGGISPSGVTGSTIGPSQDDVFNSYNAGSARRNSFANTQEANTRAGTLALAKKEYEDKYSNSAMQLVTVKSYVKGQNGVNKSVSTLVPAAGLKYIRGYEHIWRQHANTRAAIRELQNDNSHHVEYEGMPDNMADLNKLSLELANADKKTDVKMEMFLPTYRPYGQ